MNKMSFTKERYEGREEGFNFALSFIEKLKNNKQVKGGRKDVNNMKLSFIRRGFSKLESGNINKELMNDSKIIKDIDRICYMYYPHMVCDCLNIMEEIIINKKLPKHLLETINNLKNYEK